MNTVSRIYFDNAVELRVSIDRHYSPVFGHHASILIHQNGGSDLTIDGSVEQINNLIEQLQEAAENPIVF